MFKKKQDANGKEAKPTTFTYGTVFQERSPLTAAPAQRYAFEGLFDSNGRKIDEAWMKEQIDLMPSSILGPTSGALLDREIFAAVKRALDKLEGQRNEHMKIILDSEDLEAGAADDVALEIDDLLLRFEAAKRKTAMLEGSQAVKGGNHD